MSLPVGPFFLIFPFLLDFKDAELCACDYSRAMLLGQIFLKFLQRQELPVSSTLRSTIS